MVTDLLCDYFRHDHPGWCYTADRVRTIDGGMGTDHGHPATDEPGRVAGCLPAISAVPGIPVKKLPHVAG